jgi:hypothetical protein
MTTEERTRLMVDRLGEAIPKTVAAREIHCAINTIAHMLKDGRLETACAGTRVDTRSLARYICEPAAVKEERRKRKVIERYNVDPRWVV